MNHGLQEVPQGVTVTSTHPQYRSRVQDATRIVKNVTVVPGTVYMLGYCYKDKLDSVTYNMRTFLCEHSEESLARCRRAAVFGGFDLTDEGREEIATYLRSLIPSGLIVEQKDTEDGVSSKFYWRSED